MKVINQKTRTAMQYEFVKTLSPNTFTQQEMFSPNNAVPAEKVYSALLVW